MVTALASYALFALFSPCYSLPVDKRAAKREACTQVSILIEDSPELFHSRGDQSDDDHRFHNALKELAVEMRRRGDA